MFVYLWQGEGKTSEYFKTVLLLFSNKVRIKQCLTERVFAEYSNFSKFLKGLFHPAVLARVVSCFSFVVAICMGHEYGDKQRPVK